MIKHLRRRPLQFVKRYFDNIYYYLNEEAIQRLQYIGQFFGIVLLTTVVSFTIFNNITPFGITTRYSLEANDNNITSFGPKDRVETTIVNGQKLHKLNGELIYFSSTMPFDYDHATVKVTFKNSGPEQTFLLGYRRDNDYNYETKPIHVPFLDSLDWIHNGYNTVLYQREQKYISAEQFLKNPPKESIIGTYAFDSVLDDVSGNRIESYQPRHSNTVIDTPIRGKHVIYAYLENEPFIMNFYKQDLNWYTDEDIMNIKIYKDDILVHEVEVGDDGITNNSRKVYPPQEIKVKNPKAELPEKGIYKIVVEANNDTVIKKITTNLHKIVFATNIFPITNSKGYPSIVASTSATTLYTNALNLSAKTYHRSGIQNILVGDQVLEVNTLNVESSIPPKGNLSKITVPENDVILTGFMGYFSFTEDQFFLPTKYNLLEINNAHDINLVDYILTQYRPSNKVGDWITNEQFYELKNAYINNGKLNWVIKAPRIKENQGDIIIKDIQITFHKKGWLK